MVKRKPRRHSRPLPDPLPATLNNIQFAHLAGVSLSGWYEREARGEFKGLESGLSNRWSTERVQAFLRGERLEQAS